MSENARIDIQGKSIEAPLLIGSENEVGIDIAKLRSSTGAITFDPGFVNTGSCQSAITFLDGEKGILRYRGYPIEQLAGESNFMEVSYLIINGELPTETQLTAFEKDITYHTMLHEDLKHIYNAFPKNAHPMAILSCIVNALSTFYPDVGTEDEEALRLAVSRLLGKITTIAAWAYQKSIGHPMVYPKNNLDYCENLLHMMFSVPAADYEVPDVFAKALNVLFILHADHEQNCSTSTVRLVGSSKANLFSSISAGIAALSGPLHGGANQAVLEMLQEIHADGGDVQKFVKKAKDKNSGFRLMGFGHRVYKNFDPRAQIIKSYCDEVLELVGVEDPLLDIAKQLEESALKDDYFVEKKLYPNVDFYSGIIYKALGFPVPMFTPLFAIGRLPGWISHWIEMNNGPAKIGRPRQIYTGPNERPFVPITKRG
ncbi:MAG: citrate synthase [SAR324 cluster bacterium]|nr:citrate synthase [SAR324 cluster bacterium]